MKLSVIAIYFLASLIVFSFLWLSWWQYNRGHNKQIVIDKSTAFEFAAPLNGDEIPLELSASVDLRKISIKALDFYPASLLLDNMTRQGRAGLEVIQPVRINTGWLLVNFGWLPWSRGSSLPVFDLNDEDGIISGRLRLWPEKGFRLGQQNYEQTLPSIIQWLDYQELTEYFDNKLLPYIVYIDKEHPRALLTEWHFSGYVTPTKHYAYSIQWLFMALALLSLLVYYGTRRKKQF